MVAVNVKKRLCRCSRLVFAVCAFIFVEQLAHAETDSFNQYRYILSQCLLHEIGDADGRVEDILQAIKDTKLYSDASPLGVVFQASVSQHCEYTLGAIESFDSADMLPLRVTTALDWQELAARDRALYVALYASHLSFGASNQFDVTDAQVSTQRIEALRNLKIQFLQSADLTAAAIASVHLALVLSEMDPVAAIDEFKYALPYLPVLNTNEVLLTYYDQTLAHNYLGLLYGEIGLWQQVEYHGQQQYRLIDKDDLSPISFNNRIIANIALQQFDKAEELVSLSKRSVDTDVPWHMLWALRQEITLLLYRDGHHAKEPIVQLVTQAKRLHLTDPYDLWVQQGIVLTGASLMGSDAEFNQAIKVYESAKQAYAQTTANGDSDLYTYRLLSKLYALRGQYEQAYHYEVSYRQNTININALKRSGAASMQDSALAHDAEFMSLQRAKNENEKQLLELQASKLRVALFGVIILFLLVVSFWFWRNQREAKRLADTDMLTGALSRRVMNSILEKTKLRRRCACLALLDLDYFKQINDTYGHATGDEVLEMFSNIVQQRIRKTDKLFRIGGEEFLVLLQDIHVEEAKVLIDNVRSNLEKHTKWNTTEKAFSVSFSAGLSILDTNLTVAQSIAKADDLLYSAKASGRRQTIVGANSAA